MLPETQMLFGPKKETVETDVVRSSHVVRAVTDVSACRKIGTFTDYILGFATQPGNNEISFLISCL